LLCPSYKIHQRGDFKYSCYANFTQSVCGSNVIISMEAWSKNGQLYEPSLNLGINCSLRINSTTHLFPSVEHFEIISESDEKGPHFSAQILNSSISCRWSSWSSWSHCSDDAVVVALKTGLGFAVGQKTNQRSASSIDVPGVTGAPALCPRKILVTHQFGGKPCIGDDVENKRCSGADCPVDGAWSQWSRWGYCQSKCGLGNRTRTRSCDSPTPENGGRACEEEISATGDELIRHPRIAEKSEDLPVQTQEEVQSCKLKDCDPVDGRWSKWSRWSTCSVNCGRGKIVRTRACNSPTPAHGGQKCYGQSNQSRPCFLRKCSEEKEVPRTNPITSSSTTPKSFFGTTTSPNYRSNLISSRLTHFVRDDSPTSSSSSSSNQLPIPHAVDITSVLFQRLGGSCLNKPPFVHGFLGPFVKEGISISRPNRYLRVGEIAYYVCNHGKANGYLVKMYPHREGEPEWPICQKPRYCLDPAPKYAGYTPPIPRRHALVNTQILYQCIKRPNVSYSISCFPDGRYKTPEEIPSIPCEQEITVSPTVSSSSPTSLKTEEDQDTVLNEKFGWIESPGYPGVTAANYSQFKFSLVTRGYYVRIGIEDVDVQYDEMALDIDFNDQSKRLSIGESYVVKRHFVITPAFGMFKFRITFQFIAP
ncbi:Hemicentin 1, partial [Caligus rogercresseyi]